MRTARKMVPLGVAAVLAFGTAPALAQTQAPTQAVTVHQARPSFQDRMFLRTAHRGNLAEIAAAKVALRQSHSDRVRGIAWRLLRDHRRLDSDVRAVAHRFGVGLPGAPTGEQQAKLAKVASLHGHRFNEAWLRLQADAHAQTLRLLRTEVREGHSRTVRRLAAHATPVVRHHLSMVLDALHR